MYVVMFKKGKWLHCEAMVFGPFTSYTEAYNYLCDLPAPEGDNGYKYVQTLVSGRRE